MKNKLSRAYYIDTYNQKSNHEMFNASLFVMCSSIFDEVKYRMSDSAFQSVLNLVSIPISENISQKNVFVVSGDGRFILLLRYIISAIQNIWFLIFAPKDSIVIFPFNNLFSIRFLNFLNKLLKKKILVFCHGEMELIMSIEKHGGLLHLLLERLSKKFFLNSKINISEGLYFCVLGDIILENLTSLIDKEKLNKFISIDHPYIFKDSVKLKKNIADGLNLIHLGTVGEMNKVKGLEYFVNFVSKIGNYRNEIKISLTGYCNGNIELLKKNGVDISPQENKLNRDIYNKRINNLDFILFFYSKQGYKITASGAIMDALYNEKPIIAIKNDYFDYLFKKIGSFGYLVENIDEMVLIVEQILEKKINLNIDFKTLKTKLEPEIIVKQLYYELNKISFIN